MQKKKRMRYNFSPPRVCISVGIFAPERCLNVHKVLCYFFKYLSVILFHYLIVFATLYIIIRYYFSIGLVLTLVLQLKKKKSLEYRMKMVPHLKTSVKSDEGGALLDFSWSLPHLPRGTRTAIWRRCWM